VILSPREELSLHSVVTDITVTTNSSPQTAHWRMRNAIIFCKRCDNQDGCWPCGGAAPITGELLCPTGIGTQRAAGMNQAGWAGARNPTLVDQAADGNGLRDCAAAGNDLGAVWGCLSGAIPPGSAAAWLQH